jgi:uroporphyrinogen-III synthase
MHRTLYLGTDPSAFKSEGEVVHYPVIAICARDPHLPEITEAFADLQHYTHLLFTSKHTVRIFMHNLQVFGMHSDNLKGKQILAIGTVTAAHLAAHAIDPTHVAEDETQEGMIELFKAQDLQNAYLFYPRSSLARKVLDEYLQTRHVRCSACSLYDTVPQCLEPVPVLEDFDEIVFTSPSTVDAFLRIYDNLPKNIKLTAIGPITLYKISTLGL